jgi:hypothetical protein
VSVAGPDDELPVGPLFVLWNHESAIVFRDDFSEVVILFVKDPSAIITELIGVPWDRGVGRCFFIG